MFLVAGYGYVGKAVRSSIVTAGMRIPLVIDPAVPETNTWDQVDFTRIYGVIICVATPEGADG